MRGGYRKGAGRKQGFAAKNAEEARKYFSERVAQEIEPLCNLLIKQAKTGNIRAMKELFDRTWGRAPQAIQTEAVGNLPIPILVDFISQESRDRYDHISENIVSIDK